MVCLRTDSFGNWKQVFPSCSMPHFHYTLPLSPDNDEGLGLSLVQRCLLVNRRASLPASPGRFISPSLFSFLPTLRVSPSLIATGICHEAWAVGIKTGTPVLCFAQAYGFPLRAEGWEASRPSRLSYKTLLATLWRLAHA